jgi:hypothetical protein
MNNVLENIQSLIKALEGGNYNAAPSTLVQGAALQVEDLSPIMRNTTFQEQHIKLQKMLKDVPCKSMLAQFDRQLSYGIFGGSAQREGNIGQEETSDYVRVTVPMCFYSHTRRVTVASTMLATVDGKQSEERAAEDAAKKIAGDIEFDSFRGMADFSNAGVFDGNPLVVPSELPNIHGVDLQIRQSDGQANSKDLMFAEFGSDESVVISGGGSLTQDLVEDASVRSALAFGNADRLIVDPKCLSTYNKIVFGKERIILAGSPQDATGGDLRRQWVSGGTVTVEASQFLRGKFKPQPTRPQSPGAPTFALAQAGGTTPFLLNNVFTYYVTACNEKGESPAAAAAAITVGANGNYVTVTVTPGSGTYRYYNVYRTLAGGAAVTAKFIGRVAAAVGTTTVFTDLGNKQPGFVTGFLIQGDTLEMRGLAPYSRIKLAVSDLSVPEGHFKFCTLCCTEPRKDVLVDNLK